MVLDACRFLKGKVLIFLLSFFRCRGIARGGGIVRTRIRESSLPFLTFAGSLHRNSLESGGILPSFRLNAGLTRECSFSTPLQFPAESEGRGGGLRSGLASEEESQQYDEEPK